MTSTTRARDARKTHAKSSCSKSVFQFGKRFLTLYHHVSLSSSRVPHDCSQSKITCIRLASHPGVVNSTQSLYTKHTRLRRIFSFCSCLSFFLADNDVFFLPGTSLLSPLVFFLPSSSLHPPFILHHYHYHFPALTRPIIAVTITTSSPHSHRYLLPAILIPLCLCFFTRLTLNS